MTEILFRGFHPCEDSDRTVYVEGKTVKSLTELERLRAENAKLRELVGLAHTDLESAAECETCANFQDCEYNHEYRTETAEANYKVSCLDCYQWQHNDKLKGINEVENDK